jgi:anti-sigma factor RsiW
MKEDQNIDELLNGFIDGELTARQMTEVQRLVSHDIQVLERLRELQSCKRLVGSLPCAEAPAGMVEEIKASLERRTLLGELPELHEQRRGARHLLVRKVLAAAAMIGLVAVLGVVVYTIVAPETVPPRPIAVEDRQQPGGVKVEKPEPSVIVATAEKSVAETSTTVAAGFNGRLELKTSNPSGFAAVINKAIADNGLLEKVSSGHQEGKSVYAISCSREALSLLLADLGRGWEKLDSATLFVETEEAGKRLAVNKVTTEQIAEIVNQNSSERSVKAAMYFAVLNNMDELSPDKEALAAVEEKKPALLTIPKPVLTSSEKPAARAEDAVQVNLTIVVADSE